MINRMWFAFYFLCSRWQYFLLRHTASAWIQRRRMSSSLIPEVAPKSKDFFFPIPSSPVVEKVNKHRSVSLCRCFSERLLFVDVLSEDGPDDTVLRSAEEAGGDSGVGNSQAPARIWKPTQRRWQRWVTHRRARVVSSVFGSFIQCSGLNMNALFQRANREGWGLITNWTVKSEI